MKNKAEFWYEETGISSTSLFYPRKNNAPIIGCGIAQCHPDDEDVKSWRTGSVIADYRAEIELCKKIIQDELKPGLAALTHLKGTMTISKKYNPDSYEAKRLNKEIKNLQKEIEETEKMKEALEKDLTTYITLKEEAKNK